MLQVSCPGCGRLIPLAAEDEGQTIECRQCLTQFVNQRLPRFEPLGGGPEEDEPAYRAARGRSPWRLAALGLGGFLLAAGLLLGYLLGRRQAAPLPESGGVGRQAGDRRPEAGARSGPRPDFTLPAQELFTAFERSRGAAALRYTGKLVDLNGSVARLGADKKRGPYLVLAAQRWHPPGPVSLNAAYLRMAASSASGIEGVRCYLRSLPPRTTLEPGAEVRLRGRCLGMPLDVELEDCVLLP